MATPRTGARIVNFAQGVIDRIAGKRRGDDTPPERQTAIARTGGDPRGRAVAQTEAFDPSGGYFPAGKPLNPVAPPGSTTGRAFDFPPYINLTYSPRAESGENRLDFATLRRMAEPSEGGLDLLRLAIETRKDQMARCAWKVRARGDAADDGGTDAREIERVLRRPDGVHTFAQWQRALLEDHFVIDAPAIYYSASGGRPLLEPVDGATLKLLIMGASGRTPLPPLPAFQQVIKGVPAENYTLDEIGYYAYNVRTHRIYGFSPVEHVLGIINIAINRQYSQLAYFTEGTVPDGFMEVPKTWSLDEISRFTDWFNSELSGQTGERRKIRFVPADAKYVATKDQVLKDETDEWLARIICYCFSLSPQTLVKEVNRATAETAKESAAEEGLEPLKMWFKDMMDDAIERAGAPELEFHWADEEIVDPETKSRVIISYFGGATGGANKIMTLAEVRAAAGLPPATPEQIKELQPPAPVLPPGTLPGDDPANDDDEDPPAKKKPPTEKLAHSRIFTYDRASFLRTPRNGNGSH